MSRWGEGRKPKGEQALSARIFVRVTPQQYDRYLALGGSKWLREQIDAAEGRQRLTPTPTAHNPFPAFTVTDVKGQPIPHTTTTREY